MTRAGSTPACAAICRIVVRSRPPAANNVCAANNICAFVSTPPDRRPVGFPLMLLTLLIYSYYTLDIINSTHVDIGEMHMSKHQIEGKTSWIRAMGIGFAGSLVVGLVALAFLWPTKVAQPHDYPIAITGSNTQQITAIKQEITQNSSDAIDFVDTASREEAVRMMHERKVFGALVV